MSWEPVFRWAYGMDEADMWAMDSERWQAHREFAELLVKWQQPQPMGGQ